MQEFLFQDSNFKLSGNQKILSIQASLDGFSILIFEEANPSLFYLHQYPFNQSTTKGLTRKLHELLEKERPSDQTFKEINISLANNNFKLIPNTLYEERYTRQLLSANKKNEEIIANPVGEKYMLAFAVEKNITELFRHFLPSCNFRHEIDLLADSKFDISENKTVDIICHFGADYFYIISKRDHEIVFLNRFEIAAKNDILFYLASTIKLFENETYSIRLTGNILERSDIHLLLKKYYPEISFYSNKKMEPVEQKLNRRIHTLFPIITNLL